MRPRTSILPTLALAACNAPSFESFTSYQDPTTGELSSSSASSSEPTTGGGIMTTTAALSTTGEPDASSGSGSGSGSGSSADSTGAPPEPLIAAHLLTPDPLELPGPIAVDVLAEHAAGVRLAVDDADPVALTEVEPGVFHGEISFYTALDNGLHDATFTAWRDDLESDPAVVSFTVSLPDAGSELFWDGAALIGQGSVAALVVLPSGELVEFGTHYPMGAPRCYLRRRDQGGAWGPDDLVTIAGDNTCVAIDMEVDAEGALHLLASRTQAGQTRWWLGKVPTWNTAPENIGQGPPGETAHALAIHPKKIAVCSARPQPTGDLDAVASIFRPNAPGEIKTFDYVSPMEPKQHIFDETPRDCVFAGDSLLLVGEAFGKHEGDIVYDRLFVLDVPMGGSDPTWTVNKYAGLQSGGASVVVDVEGRIIVGGHTCDQVCLQAGSLWRYMPGLGFTWSHTFGLEIGAISSMAASPAGYVVVASGKKKGPWDSAFWAEAWIPDQYDPKWTYTHDDAPTLQLAQALAIGPYGQVYAGGVGAGGYPAVAYVGG